MDPALPVWVWATLVDVSLLLYERASPLSDLEPTGTTKAEASPTRARSARRVPRRYNAFTAYMPARSTRPARHVTPLVPSPDAPPLPWPSGSSPVQIGTFFTAAMLPERFRAELDNRWSPAKEVSAALLPHLARVGRLTPRWFGIFRTLPDQAAHAAGVVAQSAHSSPDELAS